MKVDLVGEPGITRRVGCRHVVEAGRTAIREDQPLPDDQRPPLPGRDDAVIFANETSALRHEQDAFHELKAC